jgi:hypothetical protein
MNRRKSKAPLASHQIAFEPALDLGLLQPKIALPIAPRCICSESTAKFLLKIEYMLRPEAALSQ